MEIEVIQKANEEERIKLRDKVHTIYVLSMHIHEMSINYLKALRTNYC